MSTTVFSPTKPVTPRPSTARHSGVAVAKGDPGPRGLRGPKGNPGPASMVPGPRGPAGPGAGRPNAIARVSLNYLAREGRPYLASALVQAVESKDTTKRTPKTMFGAESWPEGEADSIQIKQKGFAMIYYIGGPSGPHVDAVDTPVSLAARVPARIKPVKGGRIDVLVLFYEDAK